MTRWLDLSDPFSEIVDSEALCILLRENTAAAAPVLRGYAERGDAQSQLLLGQLLINGAGARRDATAALYWFRAAAMARVPMAINMVGRCHEYGYGTQVDYAAAAGWYYRASLYDCDWAIYNFAHLLANGRGVERDRAAAFAWFKLAASRGHARAMNFVGEYYENGWETPVDRVTAFAWYQRSAEGGDYRGQCSYASVLTEMGRIDEALLWLGRAVTTASPAYLTHLARVLSRATHARLRKFGSSLAATTGGLSTR